MSSGTTPPRPPRPTGATGTGPPRRAVLRAITGGTASIAAMAGLGGCGIRLESAVAPTPTRSPAPDETYLLTVLGDLSGLASAAASVAPATGVTTRLATQHRRQLAVLRDRLRTAGVPDSVLVAATGAGAHVPSGPTTAPSPGTSNAAGTSSPPSTAKATVTTARLAALELSVTGAEQVSAISRTTISDRLLLASILTMRAAAAAELGATVEWPTSSALPPTVAAGLLESTRAVVYAFEVVAAHLSADVRQAALTTLTSLRGRAETLASAAGSAAPPDPLGYDLPFAVTDASDATRLATRVTTALVAAGLEALAGSNPLLPQGSAALAALVQWEVEAVATARRWGVTPTAFPGLELAT